MFIGKWPWIAALAGVCGGCAPPPIPLAPLPAVRTVFWSDQNGTGWVRYHNGVPILVDSANGLMVGVSLFAGKDFTRARLVVVNNGPTVVTLYPRHITAEVTTPRHRALGYCDPDKIIADMESKANWANFFSALGGAFAQTTTTTTSQVDGSDAMGTFEGTVVSTTTQPDVGAQQQAQHNIATTNIVTVMGEEAIRQSALRINSIYPGQTISGVVLFDHLREKATAVTVRALIDGTAFYFQFSLSGTK